jgi:type IV secretory pathway VirB3-like protein
MDSSFLISALSLFAGVSILPAGLLLLREREIALNRQQRIKGVPALLIALVLMTTGILFLLNVIAQEVAVLLLSLVAVVLIPLAIIQLYIMRQKGSSKSL